MLGHVLILIGIAFAFLCLICWLFTSVVFTSQYQTKVISRFGKYIKSTQAGVTTKAFWPLESVAFTTSLAIQVASLKVSVKTNDNAFVVLPMKVHFFITDPIKSARLSNIAGQMDTLVQNVVRSHCSTADLDAVYSSRGEISEAVEIELGSKLKEYGLEVKDVIVDNPAISDQLAAALQGVIISERNQQAAKNNAEASRVTIIAQAQAEGERTKLQAQAESDAKALYGEGVAKEQQAIAAGFEKSIEDMTKAGLTVEQAVHFLLQVNGQENTLKQVQFLSGAQGHVTLVGGPGVLGGSVPAQLITALAASK